jgi:hypothetical protein
VLSNAAISPGPWRTWIKFPAATPSGLRLLSSPPRACFRQVIGDVSYRYDCAPSGCGCRQRLP